MLSKQEEEVLKQATKVKKILELEGWKEVIEPYLLGKLRESFPDPVQFKDDNEYLYAAKYASIYKKIVGEILQFIKEHESTFNQLVAKKDLPDPMRIGQVDDKIPKEGDSNG